MTESRDLYEILGVSRDAKQAEIKKAFKKLARKFHPDLNPGNKAAEAKFKEISHAAEILGDAEKRKLYDRFGDAAFSSGFDPGRASGPRGDEGGGVPRGRAAGGAGGFPFDFSVFGAEGRGMVDLDELLGAFGGARVGRRRRSAGNEPIEVEVEIPFSGAVKGTTVTIPVRRRLACHGCGGSRNTGKATCKECRGSGETVETERIKVRIPEGVDDGSRVRVPGKGTPSLGDGPAGDLHVVVKVRPHSYFERRGDDILSDVPITVREAYLGGEIEIPTIRGPVRAKIPPGTSGGQKFRLRGRGVRNLRTRAFGDHVYRVNVVVPSAVTEQGRAAVDRFELLYGGPVRSRLPKTLEDDEE